MCWPKASSPAFVSKPRPEGDTRRPKSLSISHFHIARSKKKTAEKGKRLDDALDLEMRREISRLLSRITRPCTPASTQTHLEKALQPPNLEDTLSNDHSQLEDTPPLHPTVRALCGVPVHPLTDHDVRLLIPDLREGIGQLADYMTPVDQPQFLL